MDFIGTWIVFATGVTLFGSESPMRGLDLRRGLIAAIKIDTLSLLAYQIGIFAFMGFQS